jgi:hypothetical protein
VMHRRTPGRGALFWTLSDHGRRRPLESAAIGAWSPRSQENVPSNMNLSRIAKAHALRCFCRRSVAARYATREWCWCAPPAQPMHLVQAGGRALNVPLGEHQAARLLHVVGACARPAAAARVMMLRALFVLCAAAASALCRAAGDAIAITVSWSCRSHCLNAPRACVVIAVSCVWLQRRRRPCAWRYDAGCGAACTTNVVRDPLEHGVAVRVCCTCCASSYLPWTCSRCGRRDCDPAAGALPVTRTVGPLPSPKTRFSCVAVAAGVRAPLLNPWSHLHSQGVRALTLPLARHRMCVDPPDGVRADLAPGQASNVRAPACQGPAACRL